MAKKPDKNTPKTGFNVEMWPIDKVKPYPGNPRTITDKAVTKVAAAIREYGWRQPIVVDGEGFVLVGHTRLRAAQALKQAEVPVHVAKGLTPEQARAYRIADNRVGEETDWDHDKLIVEVGELAQIDSIDLEALGFDDIDLEKLLGDGYAPALNPEKGSNEVDGDDVSKADQKLKGTIVDGAKQDIVDVICPHCGEGYGLSRSALA